MDLSGKDRNDETRSPTNSRHRGAVVFWLLLLMSVAALAPCVLLPEWRQLQALQLAEQAQQVRVGRMQELVGRERTLLGAMRSDPAVAGRIARRDLGFYADGEQAVSVGVVSFTADAGTSPDASSHTVLADLPLDPVPSGAVWPDPKYDRVFCDPDTRPIIMIMSVGLAAVAFALFGRRAS